MAARVNRKNVGNGDRDVNRDPDSIDPEGLRGAALAQRVIEAAAQEVAVQVEPGDIVEDGIVGGAVTLPGRPAVPTVFPGIPYELAARPDVEYVAGGLNEATLAYARSLPQYIDDLTARHGIDLYDRMQRDAQVFGDLLDLKLSVLANGLSLTPSIPEGSDGWEEAKAVSDFCQTNLNDLDTPLVPWLKQMMDALATGNRVSEIVYRPDSVGGKPLTMLYRLKPKPVSVYAFVVDNRQNVIGLLGALAGRARTVVVNASILDPQLVPNLIPKRKFAVFTFDPPNSDPRGSSMLHAAYDPWYRKQQHMLNLLRYLAQFGAASLIGETPQDAIDTPVVDSSGNPVVNQATGQQYTQTPEQALMRVLEKVKNGSCIAVPFGTKITPLYPQGNGEAFRAAIDVENREISKAILGHTLSSNEGAHDSRAAAREAKSTTDLIVDYVEQVVATMVRREVLMPLLELNWGTEYAKRFCPLVTLSKVEEVDFAAIATAIAALTKAGYIADSQIDGIDAKLNLPKRSDDERTLRARYVGDDWREDDPANFSYLNAEEKKTLRRLLAQMRAR